MNTGLWVWPSNPSAQRRILRKVAEHKHLVPAMSAIAKSKEGLSNAEVDDAIGDNAEWITYWVLRQLNSLGFTEFKVDFFGGPGRYQLTERGRSALAAITGKAVSVPQPPPKPPTVPTPPPPAPQAAAPKA
jgi:hypothetical protein